MYGRKVKFRLLFVVIILITLILTVFLVLKSLEENVVYFQSPSEIKSLLELDKKKVKFLMSNAKVDLVTDHFKDYKCDDIQARRAINSKNPESTTTEVFIYN